MNKRLLTIQDISCVGQCSLTVALPVISACGIETAVLPSAVLSTHTGGFKNYTFRDLSGDMPAICSHWNSEKLKFDAFYTGYVCENQIEEILHIMDSCANGNALRIVDPVMGDNGKLYAGFREDFPDKIKRLCRNADYILPNLTEASLMLHEPFRKTYTQDQIELMIEKLLRETGAKNVVLTGVSFDPGKLGTAVSDGKSILYDFNERIMRSPHGTGDVYASVFAGALLCGKSALEAAALAADIVCEAIRQTPEDHWYGVCFEKAIPMLVQKLS